MAPDESSILCRLCQKFTSDLIRFNFKWPSACPPGWNPKPEGEFEEHWGPSFRHHESLEDLATSANQCHLCHVLHNQLKDVIEVYICEGHLGLHPWWDVEWDDEDPKELLSNGLALIFSNLLFLLSSHEPESDEDGNLNVIPILDICSRRPFGEEGIGRMLRATDDSQGLFKTARKWIDDCSKHTECQKSRKRSSAINDMPETMLLCIGDCSEHDACMQARKTRSGPSRMININSTTNTPVLCSWTTENHQPYVALSHCWGGQIPGQTTKANKAQRQQQMTMEELPKTFTDAIQITVELGYKYIWIDALCIVQDDVDDWGIEATKMASIYAGCAVMISALEAKSSSAGILGNERDVCVSFGEDFIIQNHLEGFESYVDKCPLSRRGWCLQERLLAPAILHFGKQQIYWECRTGYACEDGTTGTDGLYVGNSISMRRTIDQRPKDGWLEWYQIVTNYSRRTVTYSSDKFPALAAAAELFKQNMSKASYIAGLWKEDIARGIVWIAMHLGNGKHPILSPLPIDRAPSWSWAAVDGEVYFPHWASELLFEVLAIEGDVSENFYGANPNVKLKIRGTLGHMRYVPPEGEKDEGTLMFDSGWKWPECVLDNNRQDPCSCWVMPAAYGISGFLLVFRKGDDGYFRRIGMAGPIPWGGSVEQAISAGKLTRNITFTVI